MPDRMNRDRAIINGLPSDPHEAPARRLIAGRGGPGDGMTTNSEP